MRILIIVVLACVAIAALVSIVWLRRARNASPVMPYGQARDKIIGSIADPSAPPPAPPLRPVGLDKRLTAHKLKQLQELWPPTKATWTPYFDAYQEVIQSIWDELQAIDLRNHWYELLSDARRTVVVVDVLEREVNNGSFDQFFLNSSGDSAYTAPDALRTLGCSDAAALAERANAQFPGGVPRHRAARLARMDDMPESAREVWDNLDSEFFALDIPFGGIAAYLGGKYVLDHPGEFFR